MHNGALEPWALGCSQCTPSTPSTPSCPASPFASADLADAELGLQPHAERRPLGSVFPIVTDGSLFLLRPGEPLGEGTTAPRIEVRSSARQRACVLLVVPGGLGKRRITCLHPAQRLPMTVRDVVNQSPATASDGSLLIGSQHTTGEATQACRR